MPRAKSPSVLCHFCQKECDPKARGTYRQTTGWAENRASGGANAITMPHHTGLVMHHACMEAYKRGISPDQEAMF